MSALLEGQKVKVTAVVLHYYKERTPNIKIIVDALKKGSYKPDKIIVFNNNPDIVFKSMKGVSVINSDTNYHGRARYPIALLEPSDYYFFIDDDMCPSKDTLKNYMQHSSRECCLGYIGKGITSEKDQYTNADTYLAETIKKPKVVDLLVGVGGIFVSFHALAGMFFYIENVLLKKNYVLGREEDIILSMINLSKVIPARINERLTKLPDGGVGYCKTDSHIKLRNKILDIL